MTVLPPHNEHLLMSPNGLMDHAPEDRQSVHARVMVCVTNLHYWMTDGQSSEQAWGPVTQPSCDPHTVAQEVGMTDSHTGACGRAGARVQVLPLCTGNSHAETHWAMAQPRGRGRFHCEWSIQSQAHKTWPRHRMGHEARA